MKLNFEQLRAFLAIVRHGSVRRAAEALHLTQPAITARIKALEDTLSVELFERTSSGMRLTRNGELLVRHAEQFERLADQITESVVPPDDIDGMLRIGASETIAQCWLPNLVSRLHELRPKVQIELNVDISVNLRAALLAREIDLAILLGPVSDYTVNNTDLPGFELAWYVAASKPHVPSGNYFDQPVITYARSTRPYRELKELMADRVGPDIALFPSSSLLACFRLVAAGLGVAALPRALGEDFVRTGEIREFDPGWRPSPLHFTASYLAEPRLHLVSMAADTALQVARDYAAEDTRLP